MIVVYLWLQNVSMVVPFEEFQIQAWQTKIQRLEKIQIIFRTIICAPNLPTTKLFQNVIIHGDATLQHHAAVDVSPESFDGGDSSNISEWYVKVNLTSPCFRRRTHNHCHCVVTPSIPCPYPSCFWRHDLTLLDNVFFFSTEALLYRVPQ